MAAHATQATQSEQSTRVDLDGMVQPDPHRPGPDRWRLVDQGPAVWAVVQHMIAEGDNDDATQASDALIMQTASDYDITETEVRAALAYYAANRAAIDTRIGINAAVAGKH